MVAKGFAVPNAALNCSKKEFRKLIPQLAAVGIYVTESGVQALGEGAPELVALSDPMLSQVGDDEPMHICFHYTGDQGNLAEAAMVIRILRSKDINALCTIYEAMFPGVPLANRLSQLLGALANNVVIQRAVTLILS